MNLTRTTAARLGALNKGLSAALVLTAALLAPWLGMPASAAGQARLNLNVSIEGIALVTDLAAQTGSTDGTINLTWTEPARQGTTAPHVYEVRASTIANIDTAAQFAAAQPLIMLSPTVIPAPGPGGGAAGFVVASLVPGVTHYFALREADSGAPVLAGTWSRGGPKNWNPSNVAAARFTPNPPNAITDLVATSSGPLSSPFAQLSWTAPLNANGVPIDRYLLKYSTKSAAEVGNADAWFNQATTTTFISGARAPGEREVFNVTGLQTEAPIYFGLKSLDVQSEVSPIDARSAGLTAQANLTLVASINVTASSGPVSGSVNLSWAEPGISGFTPPARYVIRISSAANFNDNAGFDAAQPLSALSQSEIPAPGAGGATVNFLVTGLTPGATFFFGVRETDDFGNTTSWFRSVALNLSVNNFAAAAYVRNLPDAITDLTALAGAAEGQVTLSWTAPRNQNFVPMASYTIRYASFSVASLSGDTTAWFDAATSSHTLAASAPGTTVNVTLNGLFPLTTFYFAARSADVFNEVSPIDTLASGLQASVRPKNEPPGTPSGLAAAGGIRRALISWTDMTAAQKTLGFSFYRLYRSTEPSAGFVQIATQTATSFTDRPLFAYTTYYYKVDGSEGAGGLDGVASSTASAVPFTLAPQQPYGFKVVPSSAAVSFSWAPTERFSDGTPFDGPAPGVDELQGYRVLRSTDICLPAFPFVSSTTVAVTTFTDVHNGDSYYYQVRGFNSLGQSTATFVLSSLGDHTYASENACASRVAIDRQSAFSLDGSSNSVGGDILIATDRHPDQVGGEILQSVSFRPMLSGVTELKGFYLTKPARITLRFETAAGGAPVPDTSPLGAAGLGVAAGMGAAATSMEHLGVYWHNGQEFKKLYGKIDPLTQTVSIDSPNLGLYQIRSVARSASTVFDLSNISARVITPNGDGLNDQVIFTYDPGPRNVLPEGTIYDMRGAVVAKMTGGLVPNTLVWDGTMNGTRVTSGVYVYRMTGDGKAFSGTIVVAR